MKEKELIFVTRNKKKVKEARDIFKDIKIEQLALDVPEIQSMNIEDVAREKAKSAADIVGKAVIVEDTGLHLSAFDGFPGALVRYVVDYMGNNNILRILDGEENRAAVAKTVIALCEPGSEPIIFVGEKRGDIASAARGARFGFDPIFIPDGYDQTYAEMTIDLKNRISHRKIAFEKLREYLLK